MKGNRPRSGAIDLTHSATGHCLIFDNKKDASYKIKKTQKLPTIPEDREIVDYDEWLSLTANMVSSNNDDVLWDW